MTAFSDLFKITIIKNISNGFLYFGGTLLALAISLYTFPIYSNYLSVEDFGIIGYYGSIQMFFTPISILSMTNYYIMRFFTNTEEENKILLFNLNFFLSVLNIILIILAHIIIYVYFTLANVTIPFYPYTLFILITLFFNVFSTFTMVHYRIKKKAFKFFLISITIPLLNAFFSILFVKYYSLGAAGRLAGIMAAYIIVSVICLLSIRRDMTFIVKFSVFKTAFQKISPMIVASYANIPLYSVDNLYLERLKRIDEMGYYNIGKQIAGFFRAAGSAVFQAFEPDFYRSVIHQDLKKYRLLFVFFLVILSVGLIIFYFIAEPLVDYLTSGKYLKAVGYTKVIVIGSLIGPIIQALGVVLMSHEKVKQNALIDIVGGISSVIIYYFLIKLYGFEGAGIGQVIIPLIMLVTVIFLILKYKLWKITS